MIQPKSEECDHIKFLIEEKDSEEEAFYEDLDGFEENGTQETRISPYTFCKAFPFHLMFDKDLILTQCGNAIFRVLPQVRRVLRSVGTLQENGRPLVYKTFTFSSTERRSHKNFLQKEHFSKTHVCAKLH